MDDTKRRKATAAQRQSKLTEVERSYIMTLLASGLSLREVSRKAAEKGITISYQNVAKYRPKVAEKLPEIIADKDDSALKRGIALKEVRIQKLADMESLMYDSIRRRVKAGHSVDAYEFREWRGLLNDVAFQSTLPRGERRRDSHLLYWFIKISIHAPARGATCRVCNITSFGHYFNPRSREGSDLRLGCQPTRQQKFQSTLPRGDKLAW